MSELLSIIRVLICSQKQTPPQEEKLKYLDIASQIQSICWYTRDDGLYFASKYLSDALRVWHVANNQESIDNDPCYKNVVDALEKLERAIDLV